jgi:EmrB/QacA subfamily drug resistance transporter
VAVVTESFPANERGRAIGISGTIVSVGIAIGPTLGGFLVENLSWHWIFFVNLPIGIVGTLMVMRYVPAVPPRGGQRFDFPGAILLFFALLTFLLAFTLLQSLGFESGWVIGMFVAWLVFLVAFIIVEFYRPEPMIDLRLFGNKLFSVNLLSSVLAFICLAGIQILMPFYLENILGYSPHQAGMLLVAVPLALGVVAPISGVLSDRFGTRVIAIVGLSILAMAFWGLSHLNFDTSSLAYFCLYLPIGIGFGFFQSPNNSAIMGIAPRDRLGVVSSMLAVSRTLGQVIGIAVMGALWASRVFYYEGSRPQGGATTAAAYSQVAGLQDILLLMAGVICLALVLYVWASWSSREKTTETPHPI